VNGGDVRPLPAERRGTQEHRVTAANRIRPDVDGIDPITRAGIDFYGDVKVVVTS
jgi:hypothetical protein